MADLNITVPNGGADLSIDVAQGNNVNLDVSKGNEITLAIDRGNYGPPGVGIDSVAIVYVDPYYYLEIFYSNGTTELVQLPAIATGVTSFNTRIGVVTLLSSDVTGALGYTPPTPAGLGATGTWAISVSGNAATVTNGVYTISDQTIGGNKTFSNLITGSISGNAGTVTNGVYTTGSYNNPSWITGLAGSKVTGIPNSSLTNSSITINGNTVSLGGSTTVTATATNALTIGTGLSGTSYNGSTAVTIAIANTTVLSGSYGAANKTLIATTNAQGQLTALSETAIAIVNTQVSGLGTASTLNAGVALGVATLDGSGTVPTSQLPAAVLGALKYQGTWNASTNTPTLTSSVGTQGYYYVVNVAGSTNLNGITDWQIGDWAIYSGTEWQKIDNTDAVTSVNGFTGTVVLTTSNITEGTNLYFTTSRARASVSAGTGISYNSATGVITNSAPDQTVVLTGAGTTVVTGTYPSFTITSNDAYVGTVTSVAATVPSVFSISGSPITTSGTLAITYSGIALQ